MAPFELRQYLYQLAPKADLRSDARLLRGVANIGKLDIVWRSNMGERGRLQTSALQRVVRRTTQYCSVLGLYMYSNETCNLLQAPGFGDIRVTVESIPKSVAVDQCFNTTLRILNCTYVTYLYRENLVSSPCSYNAFASTVSASWTWC